MTVVIDYDLGNVGSLLNMLKKAGVQAKLSGDHAVIRQASRLFLPGVGSFDAGMTNLEQSGIREVIQERVVGAGVPIMGICLGFQLLTKSSEEGVKPGLGWLDAETIALRKIARDPGLRVPHMGWSPVQMKDDPLFTGLGEDTRFYFVHTYGVDPATCRAETLCTSDFGAPFVSAARSGHVMGTQFHPEKSHRFGLQLLRNFCSHE